jgi:hypothetical protein
MQLRNLLQEDLPAAIHNISQKIIKKQQEEETQSRANNRHRGEA